MAAEAPGFTLTTTPAAAGQLRCRVEGVAGFATATALLARGSAEFAGHAQVEVELDGIQSADSAGLAVLLSWVERARRADQALTFKGLPPALSGIARVCAVEELLRAAEHPPPA